MDTELDQSRFDRSLNEVKNRGGGVRLSSWAGKDQDNIPETSSKWGDIATTLRSFVSTSKSGVSIEVIPNGRATEKFDAIWIKARREPLENEGALPEEAMDALIFQDSSKFFFDEWSEGSPYTMVALPNQKSGSFLKSMSKWALGIFTAIIIAAAIKYLGLS